MRTIKFRMWNGEEFINWKTIVKCENNLGILNNKSNNIMQFTGLKDKLGVDIYEGDILLNEEGMGDLWTCEFNKGCFILKLIGDDHTECVGNVKGFKIIGNVYENEELIR